MYHLYGYSCVSYVHAFLCCIYYVAYNQVTWLPSVSEKAHVTLLVDEVNSHSRAHILGLNSNHPETRRTNPNSHSKPAQAKPSSQIVRGLCLGGCELTGAKPGPATVRTAGWWGCHWKIIWPKPWIVPFAWMNITSAVLMETRHNNTPSQQGWTTPQSSYCPSAPEQNCSSQHCFGT